MHVLLAKYYDGADRELFDKDLSEKDEVITILHAGVLCGFTTLKWYLFAHEGHEVAILYSGDTITTRWGAAKLARTASNFDTSSATTRVATLAQPPIELS